MSEALTIRDRIESRITALLVGVGGIASGNVQRFHEAGNRPVVDADNNPPEAWIVVLGGDESASDEGAVGMTECTMEIEVEIHIRRIEGDTESLTAVANRWLSRVELALPMKFDDVLTESGGTQIAHRIRKTGSDSYRAVVEGQPEIVAVLSAEIDYRHPLGQPTTIA